MLHTWKLHIIPKLLAFLLINAVVLSLHCLERVHYVYADNARRHTASLPYG